MKIKEILSKEELKRCTKYGLFYDEEALELELSNHILDMELKDFIEYRKISELKSIRIELIRFNEREEY